MYQRIILLHVNDLIEVIFAARFIWRQHSNTTKLHDFVYLGDFVKILSFDTPQRNSSLCDQHENIIPCVEFNIV